MTAATQHLLEAVKSRILDSPLGPSVRSRYSLAAHTTYRVGGPARLFVTVDNLAELETLAVIVSETVSASPLPTLIVGRGSNLLVADRGFDGLAIALGPALGRFEIAGSTVRAGGAALLPVLARASADAGLTGFEWGVGVPGTVGGAVRMNAGGHGAEIKDSLVEAVVVDLHAGQAAAWEADDFGLSYRSSSVESHQVVASARFRLAVGDAEAARTEVAEIVRWRRANQPGGRNAGSVFTNPDHAAAGWLIESAGAKGLRIGSAEVSTKHANFIQSDENGRAADIVEVMREVRRRVTEAHGVELQSETRLAGFDESELP